MGTSGEVLTSSVHFRGALKYQETHIVMIPFSSTWPLHSICEFIQGTAEAYYGFLIDTLIGSSVQEQCAIKLYPAPAAEPCHRTG